MANNYTEFEMQLLVASLLVAEDAGEDMVPVRSILERYRLDGRPHWLERAVSGLTNSGYAQDTRTLGSAVDDDIWLTAAGVKEAERLLSRGVEVPVGRSPFLNENAPVEPEQKAVPVGIEDIDVVSEIPASDRLVPIDHNQPQYKEITRQIGEMYSEIRGNNSLDISYEERDRILHSLESAQSLWQAVELKLTQVKVGILMAAEDAREALKTTAKAVAAALLVDAIKSFIKTYAGIDLDTIK